MEAESELTEILETEGDETPLVVGQRRLSIRRLPCTSHKVMGFYFKFIVC